VIYLSDIFHMMLNISKHYLGRNSDLLPKVYLRSILKLRSTLHEVAWLFFGLQFWTDVCLAGSYLQLLLGHYSVRIGYQREQSYTAIFLKHVS